VWQKAHASVAVYRELLVVEHQLTEQLDLLDLIARRRGQSLDRLRLDRSIFDLDLHNFLQRLRREYCAALLVPRASATSVAAARTAEIDRSARCVFI